MSYRVAKSRLGSYRLFSKQLENLAHREDVLVPPGDCIYSFVPHGTPWKINLARLAVDP